jgi:protein TonB
MVVCYPQARQPWSGNREEDRRFRRILLAVLLVFGIMSYLVPHWTLPPLETPWEPDLPPRIARLIAERLEPAPRQGATAQRTAPAPVAASASRPAAVDLPADTPAAAPRGGAEQAGAPAPDRVAQTGVLALSERLAELRSRVPLARMAEPRAGAPEGDTRARSRPPSRLTADVAGGSVGIGADPVSTREVLGAGALPGKSLASVQPASTGGGDGPDSDGASAERPGSGRSQEEIQEILDRNKRAIYALYNRELRFDPTLRGKVVVGLTIAPSGAVTECRILSSELNAASLEQKLVLLIKRIDFGAKPGVPSVSTRVPIEFFPA